MPTTMITSMFAIVGSRPIEFIIPKTWVASVEWGWSSSKADIRGSIVLKLTLSTNPANSRLSSITTVRPG
ncbi:hypothetical protein D3C71_1942280 [compost metagenome]